MSELVPVIDLAPFLQGDEAARRAVAAQVDEACRTVGFLSVVNHGVDQRIIDDMLAATTAFFDLPEEEKLRSLPPTVESNRGYARMGSEALSYGLGIDSLPDLFEAFNIGTEHRDLDDPYYAVEAHRMFAANVWPEQPAHLRAAALAYWEAVRKVGEHMMDVFALALGLPDRWFLPAYDRAPHVIRCNNYQRRADTPDAQPGQMRMGAHSDYGSCTILLADPVPGLQIVGPDGAWHDVQPAPGAFLVNLGDLLAEWTNDRWRSTLHRVVPPPAGTTGAFRRRSIAFFFEANHDFLVEVLPTCTSAENPPKYAPVTAGDHLMAKLMGPRTLTKSDAVQTVGDRQVVAAD